VFYDGKVVDFVLNAGEDNFGGKFRNKLGVEDVIVDGVANGTANNADGEG